MTSRPAPRPFSHIVLEQFQSARERGAPVGDDAHQVEADVVVGLAARGDPQPVRDDASELVRPLLVGAPRTCPGSGGRQGERRYKYTTDLAGQQREAG